MQASPPETGISDEDGFLQSSVHSLNNKLQKPFFWLTIFVFMFTVGIGYLLGNGLVVNNGNVSEKPSVYVGAEKDRVITLLEVSDFTEDEPELLSFWFIHLRPGDKPRLGFTPVSSITMQDDKNFKLLKQFSLDKNKRPSQKFLQEVGKLKVASSGYVLVDQVAVAAYINWFAGKDSGASINLENHSMSEYGQILREMCKTFPKIAESGIPEFPWSKFISSHLITSLSFDQVIINMNFLTSSISPQCEMVPLP
jgi:hypothetical protein